MAATMHQTLPPHPQVVSAASPSFSRSSTASTLHTFAGSRTFDQTTSISTAGTTPISATPSVSNSANTATATPPPKLRSRSSGFFAEQHGMQTMNGIASYAREKSFNDGQPMQIQPMQGYPQIYTAVYSGVSVYEMMVNSVAVMRRRSDGWLNATQILKVAGVDKGKRTKVLEREILTGEHEKVQGGYGKYQGTWINYQRGVEFCRQYAVEELLRPLLEYDMDANGVSSQNGVETPTKEQAMAARRKRMLNGGIDSRNAQSPGGTFFKNISATASNAVAAISKAQIDSPNTRPNTATYRGAHPLAGQQPDFSIGSQQSMVSMNTESSFGPGDTFFSQNSGYFPQLHGQDADIEPPRKRMRASPSVGDSFAAIDPALDVSMADSGQELHFRSIGQDSNNNQRPGLLPLEWPNSKDNEEKMQKLCTLFTDESSNNTDYFSHPVLQELTGEDLDIPLDKSCHTMLHWAATLANLPLIKALVSKGASAERVNTGGETPLIRACLVTNAFDQSCFSQMLEVFGATIDLRDNNDRTVLHHIALSSAVSGRGPASRYYLESLLEFVVRQGSGTSSQQTSFNGALNTLPSFRNRPIGLGRFMSEIVNARDKSGDTALNIAARIGNRSIISQLLEVKADATIANRAGLRPIDFGVGGDAVLDNLQDRSLAASAREQASRAVGETSRDILSSISTLLTQTEKDFAEEMASKQELIDTTHIQLRDATKQLADEKSKHVEVEKESSARAQQKMKVENLHRAVETELIQAAVNGDDKEVVHNMILPNELPPEVFDKAHSFSTATTPVPINVTQKQFSYLAQLPSTAVLRSRLQAYQRSRQLQQEKLQKLEERSSEQELKYRRVVALCTGVEEGRVDELLTSLVVAVQSEKELMDVDRVRGFLRRIEGVEA